MQLRAHEATLNKPINKELTQVLHHNDHKISRLSDASQLPCET